MTSFYYYDQNPSGFCFLVQIRAFVIQTLLGLQNLNMKEKTERIMVVVVKWRHRANGLFYHVYMIGGVTCHLLPRLSGVPQVNAKKSP